MDACPRIFARTFKRPKAVPVPTLVPFAFVHINKCAGSSVEIALGIGKRHATAMTMRRQMGAEEWARRFTFSIVRNPFDRLASIFYYRLRTDQHGLGDRHIGFNRWVAKVLAEKHASYIGEPLMLLPAANWLVDETGEILVDRVARFETLGQDWAGIAEVLGVSPTLRVTNWNLRPPYRGLFTRETRALVEETYRADLNCFGYDF